MSRRSSGKVEVSFVKTARLLKHQKYLLDDQELYWLCDITAEDNSKCGSLLYKVVTKKVDTCSIKDENNVEITDENGTKNWIVPVLVTQETIYGLKLVVGARKVQPLHNWNVVLQS